MDSKARSRIRENSKERELSRMLDEFCSAYCIQKGTDLDEVELCVYEENHGKTTVMYFRIQSKELRLHGIKTKQS